MQVVVNDLMTNYTRAGKGKVVLLLHGWGDTARGLASIAQYLKNDYDVVSLDLPGFGGTQTPAEAWGLTNYADFVTAFCKKLGLNVYALIGHSNGGALAIRGLAKESLHADKLVLLASAGIRGEYKGRVKALRYVVKAGKLVTLPLPSKYKKKLQQKVYKTVGSDMLVAEHMQETFKKVVADDVRRDAAQVTIPTLLLYGEDDTATPPAWGRLLHGQIQGSRFEIVKDAGHFLHLDRPRQVEELVEEFLHA